VDLDDVNRGGSWRKFTVEKRTGSPYRTDICPRRTRGPAELSAHFGGRSRQPSGMREGFLETRCCVAWLTNSQGWIVRSQEIKEIGYGQQ
jgi:hypothetical protein